MQHSTTPEMLTLDEVKDHFDHWRLTMTRQGKIPQSFCDFSMTIGTSFGLCHFSNPALLRAARLTSYHNKINMLIDEKVTSQ